jgi:predicted nucleic acid-binding protein
MYLLHTDVLADLIRQNPCQSLLKWCEKTPAQHLYMSVLTIGSLKQQTQEISSPNQRNMLNLWLSSNLLNWFEDNVLPIDAKISSRWGDLFSTDSKDLIDNLIVATAIENNFVLVTGSNKFCALGLKIFNPFI